MTFTIGGPASAAAAIERAQARHEALLKRVTVIPIGKRFIVNVDGDPLWTKANKMRRFMTEGAARDAGLAAARKLTVPART